MFRAAWALTGSREDAEDLVQDTFTKVLSRPRIVRGDERGYLLQAMRNTFYTRIRTASRRPQTTSMPEGLEPADPRSPAPQRAAEVNEILGAVSELPEDFRLAIVAVDILGLSYGEAAKALDVPEATITTRLYRARQRIARQFADPPPDLGKDPARAESYQMDSQMTDPEIPDPTDPEQQRAISLLRSVDVAAPDALRARLEAMIDEAGGRKRRPLSVRWRNTLFVPAATALAIVIVALVVLLGSGSSAPSVGQTATLALSSATGPAPARDAGHPDLLAAGVDGIPFPSYVSTPGWRATGSRTQVVHQRTIVTIYYRAPDGSRVGYSIVPGHTLTAPGGATTVLHGVRYSFGRVGSGRYVTWSETVTRA